MGIFTNGAGFRGLNQTDDTKRSAQIRDAPSNGVLFGKRPVGGRLVDDDNVFGGHTGAIVLPINNADAQRLEELWCD